MRHPPRFHFSSKVCWGLLGAILLAGPFLGGVLLAQEEDAPLRAATRSRTFLEQIARGEEEEALDELLVDSPLLRDEQQVEQLKSGIRQSMTRYGRFVRLEQLKVERIGRSLIRCVYLYHCDDYPVVWRLTYYRPHDDGPWNLISLRYGLDYDALPATP